MRHAGKVRWFRQLRWRLTLLYVGVTIGLILAAVIAGAIYSYFRYRTLHQPIVIATFVAGLAPELVPYVESAPVNEAALTLWLKQQNERIQNGTGSWRGLSFYSDPSIYAAVAGLQGEILAESSEGRRSSTEQRTAPTTASFIRAALDGETDIRKLSSVEADGTVVAAAPIKGSGNRSLGALIYRTYAPFNWDVYWGKVARGLAAQLLVFMALALTVGIGFGLVTTRRLVKRLGVISATADEWARGNFSASVSDRSGDEVGRLAGRLNSMAEELKEVLALRQELAGMEERNRLARDLHDTVKQQVFALGMQIGAAQAMLDGGPAQAHRRLAEAEGLVRQIQDELVTIIKELQPVSHTGKGFEQTLREHAENWSRQSGVAAEVQVDGELTLAPEAEHAFLRIAQEALSNISRHSGAKHASIRLGQEADGIVTLSVKDDGSGFDTGHVNGGMGMRNMRERAEALPGGWFRVESEQGRGSRVMAGAHSAQRTRETNHV